MSRPCIFLDRDGVINQKPPEGAYIGAWEQFNFVPGVANWIRLFNDLGFLVIVVTNQRGIARGLTSRDAVEAIHRNMIASLALNGARIDDVLYCPHEEGACDCRKPSPGLVRQAQAKWDIDLTRSILIGDSDRDRKLAQAVGLPFIHVKKDNCWESSPAQELGARPAN